jgi:hypothetical protein
MKQPRPIVRSLLPQAVMILVIAALGTFAWNNQAIGRKAPIGAGRRSQVRPSVVTILTRGMPSASIPPWNTIRFRLRHCDRYNWLHPDK